MKHEVDLSYYSIRTDLAIESINENVKMDVNEYDSIKVSSIFLDEKSALEINKKIGNYITIEFDDITDCENMERVQSVFSNEIKNILFKMNISDDASCLVVGLGNSRSTPDSLGPLSVNKLVVTNHLFKLGSLGKGYRRVSAINPGVMGETGIETSDIIKSIVSSVKPDFLIVIDALASSSLNRVNKTIDLTQQNNCSL